MCQFRATDLHTDPGLYGCPIRSRFRFAALCGADSLPFPFPDRSVRSVSWTWAVVGAVVSRVLAGESNCDRSSRSATIEPRSAAVPSMYLGQAHFFEETLGACGQPGLWRAKTNNMPKIVPKVGSILAPCLNRAAATE
jgi:hypothetical protein